MTEKHMHTIKRNALIAFGLFTTLQLATAQAQSDHDGHHPDNATAPRATQPKPQPGGMMNHEGMDHDQMMQMHEEHMGSGQMDHDKMGKGQMKHDMPMGADKGHKHDH
jgi:uncharacterized protein involved in copper resistance